jgi:hypothetical protein
MRITNLVQYDILLFEFFLQIKEENYVRERLTSAHISGRMNSESLGIQPQHLLYNRRGLAGSDSEFMCPEIWAMVKDTQSTTSRN